MTLAVYPKDEVFHERLIRPVSR